MMGGVEMDLGAVAITESVARSLSRKPDAVFRGVGEFRNRGGFDFVGNKRLCF